MSKKTVFLTTLGETKNKLDVGYYMCDTLSGTPAFTTGISVAEAGVKYILSQLNVDRIILIGPCEGDDELVRTTIDKVKISGVEDYDNMSEHEFLNYRIAEFLMQMDVELLDVAEAVSGERQAELMKAVDEFRAKLPEKISVREFFTRLATESEFEARFRAEVLDSCAPEEAKWLIYNIYNQMDSFYKMHMREENKGTETVFVPIPQESALSIETITMIVDKTLGDERSDIDLYVDIQGLGFISGNTLLSTFLLMNSRAGYNLKVTGVINSFRPAGMIFGSVSNRIKNYKIQKIITGLDLFLRYGKVDMLKKYFRTLDVTDPDADRIFYGMDCVDEGITLCNVDLIECGINVIRKTIQSPLTPAENRDVYMKIIMHAIRSDYGALLVGEELSIPELLKWSLRKGLYQQILTIIESKVPEDMVKRGIYYYAEKESDVIALMKEFNFMYWNEVSKMRWAFNDIEHYFIKLYGRGVLDYRQKPDRVAKDYAKLRIDAIRGRTKEIMPAFTQLNNDDLLYELLLAYYRIGNLRNQVNHAEVDEPNLDLEDLSARKDNRDVLDVELKKFIDLYTAACEKTVKTKEPYLLPSRRMKAYTRRHELKPLEADSDLVHRSRCSCAFNGKEIQVDIAMFKPEPDYEED